MSPECWIYLEKLYVRAEKEFQTVVWLLAAPPLTAVRGSGILLSSSSASPASPFPSSSLGIRKSSLSVGRPEAHLATSFLDSRSVGCSSTVRKERGLEKVGFPNHTFWWHTHYLDSSNFLSIGQSWSATRPARRAKPSWESLPSNFAEREVISSTASVVYLLGGRGYLWGNNISHLPYLDLQSDK